ncbi:MAG: hypothetical protein PVSMB4_12100 [Ktedonobacterales bacterium]
MRPATPRLRSYARHGGVAPPSKGALSGALHSVGAAGIPWSHETSENYIGASAAARHGLRVALGEPSRRGWALSMRVVQWRAYAGVQ